MVTREILVGSSSSTTPIELSLIRERLTPPLRLYVRNKYGGSLVNALQHYLSMMLNKNDDNSYCGWRLEKIQEGNFDDQQQKEDEIYSILSTKQNSTTSENNNNENKISMTAEVFDAAPSMKVERRKTQHQDKTTIIEEEIPTGKGNWLESVFERDAAIRRRQHAAENENTTDQTSTATQTFGRQAVDPPGT